MAVAIMGGDAGRDAFARLDGHGERGAIAGQVGSHHRLEPKLLRARLSHRQADQAATMLGHEIDRIGRRHLRRNDEVALVLPVFRVDKDHHPAVAQVFNDLGRIREEPASFLEDDCSRFLGQRRNSNRRAT
jgi:hypothetical protein